MKRSFTLLGLLLAIGSMNLAHAQTEVNVSIELVYSDDGTVQGYPAGYNTWRIYAILEGSNDFLSFVYAVTGGDPLTISTSTGHIWNSGEGAILGSDINPSIFDIEPAAAYDSWVTVNMEDDNADGYVNALCLLPSSSAIDDTFGASAGVDEVDDDLYVEDGGWHTLLSDNNGFVLAPDNRVLIAQVTTDGNIEVCMNFQVFPDGINGELTEYDNYCNSAMAPLSVEEQSFEAPSLSPNPARNFSMLQLDSRISDANVEVLDLTGSTVQQHRVTDNRVKLETTDLSSGVYLVRISHSEGTVQETLRWIVE